MIWEAISLHLQIDFPSKNHRPGRWTARTHRPWGDSALGPVLGPWLRLHLRKMSRSRHPQEGACWKTMGKYGKTRGKPRENHRKIRENQGKTIRKPQENAGLPSGKQLKMAHIRFCTLYYYTMYHYMVDTPIVINYGLMSIVEHCKNWSLFRTQYVILHIEGLQRDCIPSNIGFNTTIFNSSTTIYDSLSLSLFSLSLSI